jgi:hypothetical protein
MVKKMVLLLVAAAMIVSIVAAGCTSNQNNTTSSISLTNTYNSTQGFSIMYPSNWTLSHVAPNNATANFTAPDNVTSLEVSVIPNTTSQDVSQGLNLVTSLVKSLNESNLTEFTAVAGNASILSTTNTTVAGLPATQVVWTMPLNGVQMKVLETWILKGSTLYQVVYTAPASSYDTYVGAAQQMMNSLQLT